MTRRRTPKLFVGTVMAIVAAFLGYGVVYPVVTTLSQPGRTTGVNDAESLAEVATDSDRAEFSEELVTRIRFRLLEAIGVAWLFFLGACFGSFMNVVVYRLPLGKTLVGRSYCPRCRQAIHAADNFPVLGWLRLGGRCRSCQLPIAVRYPLVELLTGLAFLALALAELAFAGVNLPIPWDAGQIGFVSLISTPDPLLLAIFPYHASLILILLTAALIAYDRWPIPISLTLFGIIIGAGAMLAWPALHVQPWITVGALGPDAPGWPPRLAELATSLFSAVMVGLLLHELLAAIAIPATQPAVAETDVNPTPANLITDASENPDDPIASTSHHLVSAVANRHQTAHEHYPYSPVADRSLPVDESAPPPDSAAALRARVAVMAPILLTGLFLGWRSLFWVLLGACLFRAFAVAVGVSWNRFQKAPAAFDWWFGVVVYLLAWRWMATFLNAAQNDSLVWAAPLAFVAAVAAYVTFWKLTLASDPPDSAAETNR